MFSVDAITLAATNVASCVSKGKSEHYDCRNHIRVIQPLRATNRLYVCGTNAHHPMDLVINANLTRSMYDRFPGVGDGIAKCPFDPEDNSTAVWVEHGNPSDLPGLYSGTVAEFTKADTVIFRTNLYNLTTGFKAHPFKRTIKYDSKWLDKPHFVGSYDIGEFVYFFFRESAVEYINCGKSVYSRVARVCKKDTGGKNILNKNWASFLKARLNCSIPGEFPFYFNEIQSIYRHPDDERTFYGVFTTSMYVQYCRYLTLAHVWLFNTCMDIKNVRKWCREFNEGRINVHDEQRSGRPSLPESTVARIDEMVRANRRITLEEIEDGLNEDCSHFSVHKIVSETLGYRKVSARAGYITQSGDGRNGLMGSAICTYTLDAIEEVFAGKFKEQLASSSAWLPVLSSKVPEPRPGLCVNDTQTLPDSVLNFIRSHPLMDSAVAHAGDRPVFYIRDVTLSRLAVDRLEVDGVPYTVFYAGTNTGLVYKLVQWRHHRSNLVDIFQATAPEPIRAMEISSKWPRKALYVSSDSGIKQVDLVMCHGRYDSCLRCIQDPYCGWDKDRGECKPYVTGLLQDVTNATPGICDKSIRSRPMRVYWGQSVHLACPVQLPAQSSSPQWFHYSREGQTLLTSAGGKFIPTADHGLVVVSVTEREAGRYICRLGGAVLCSYNLTVDTKSCTTPSETDYRKVYSEWCHEFEKYKSAMKSWQNKQAKCQLTHPNDVAYQGTM
ncbi:Sema-2a [Cordylochernes scorpioides]|uniref:Sema-2a n=1 Tax=Cordylochernes scorpioides TaxID=51811 RepID=A0ABY6KNC2_9ARAC|nr:Sema-2a [Cordylochernes scorpioides]